MSNQNIIINNIDKSITALCIAGQSAARAQLAVLKAMRKGFATLDTDTMSALVRGHCERVVNHPELSVADMYTGLRRSILNAAKANDLRISFSKKNNADKTGKVVEVTITAKATDGTATDATDATATDATDATATDATDATATVTTIAAQAAPKPVATATDDSGSNPGDFLPDLSGPDDSASLTLDRALDIVLASDDAQVSPNQLLGLIEKFYPAWSPAGRQSFVAQVRGLVERSEKGNRKAKKTGKSVMDISEIDQKLSESYAMYGSPYAG